MFARKVLTQLKVFPKPQFSSTTAQPVDDNKSSFMRKGLSFVLITVTGGVSLSALDDLAIYHACSRKAMEKASNNQGLKDVLGEPIEKGPWYNATLAVSHKRRSASCTFPVSGPRGNGILQLKAMKNGDDNWLSYLRPRDWEILIMEALLHVPDNDEKTQTFRMTILDDLPSSPAACSACINDCPRKEVSESK